MIKIYLNLFFLAGGPGSGKSFISNIILGNKFKGANILNSDIFFEFLLTKHNLDKILSPDLEDFDKKMELRNKAKKQTKIKTYNYVNGMLPIYIDGTGKKYEKIKSNKLLLNKIGYDTSMIFVNTSLNVDLKRNKERERSIDDKRVEQMWKQVQDIIGKFQVLFGNENFHIIDNNTYFEKDSLDFKKWEMKLFKMGQEILTSSLKNPIRIKILNELKKQNKKYLDELTYDRDLVSSLDNFKQRYKA